MKTVTRKRNNPFPFFVKLKTFMKNVNTNYTRVLPRDLFNEAKLLKCMGYLCLRIHDRNIPCAMDFSETGDPFKIALLMQEAALTITNLEVTIKGKPFLFMTTYNSKQNYPLFLFYENCEYLVFDEEGNFTEEFKEFCETVK